MVDQYQIAAAEERGYIRGLKKAQEELKREVLFDALVYGLNRTLGEVPESVFNRLTSMTRVELEDLIVEVRGMGSFADVEAWIAARTAR